MNTKTLFNFFKTFLAISYLLLATCLADEIVIEGDLDVEKNSIFGGDAQFLGSVQVAPQGDLLSLDPAAVNEGNAARYLNPDNGLLVAVRCSKLDASVAHTADTTPLLFGAERLDTHNAFADGVFTAPYTALYSFEGLVDLGAATTIQGYKNDVLDDEEVSVLTSAGVAVINTIVSLQIGETYEFRIDTTTSQDTTSTNLSIVSLNVWEQPIKLDSVAKVKRTVYLTREMYEQAISDAGGVLDTDYATWEHPNPGTEIRFEVKLVGGGAGGSRGSVSLVVNAGTETVFGSLVSSGSGGSHIADGLYKSSVYNLSADFYGYGDGGGSTGSNSFNQFRVGLPSKVIFGTISTDQDISFSVGKGGSGISSAQSGSAGLIEITWYE